MVCCVLALQRFRRNQQKEDRNSARDRGKSVYWSSQFTSSKMNIHPCRKSQVIFFFNSFLLTLKQVLGASQQSKSAKLCWMRPTLKILLHRFFFYLFPSVFYKQSSRKLGNTLTFKPCWTDQEMTNLGLNYSIGVVVVHGITSNLSDGQGIGREWDIRVIWAMFKTYTMIVQETHVPLKVPYPTHVHF